MSIEAARAFFLWCSVINIGILLVWAARHARAGLALPAVQPVVPFSPDHLDMLNLAGLTLYKTAIFLFGIVPCISLHLIR